MTDREPALLGDPAEAPAKEPTPAPAPRAPTERPARAPTARPRVDKGPSVHVVGFWKRAAAAGIDLAIIVPVASLLTWITAAIAGVHIPRSNMHGPDFWLDLFLASDPALLMALGLFTAIGCIYLFVFQVTMGRTLGMHVLKLRVIDLWGDTPSNTRCAVRTAGYLANALTFFLGFLWIGFDSEKRGLHDWIAGTYVIKG
ncbi:MAG TPA: RDD family protein [Kofleriaceae bacterium]|nr:RDD family protein [Kofleriaceae bacterium]